MSTALLTGVLTALVLARLRLRPDHRLRDDVAPQQLPRIARRPRRHRPAGPDELASWCDALARDIRAGSTLGAAVRTTDPPAGSSLADLGHRLRRGAPLGDAVGTVHGSSHEQAITTVLAALARHGGPAAPPLDRVAATLRRRAADADERAVHSAQARLSAVVMTALPGGVLVLLFATSAPVRHVVHTPPGFAMVLTGLALNTVGWAWMRRLVRGRRR